MDGWVRPVETLTAGEYCNRLSSIPNCLVRGGSVGLEVGQELGAGAVTGGRRVLVILVVGGELDGPRREPFHLLGGEVEVEVVHRGGDVLAGQLLRVAGIHHTTHLLGVATLPHP